MQRLFLRRRIEIRDRSDGANEDKERELPALRRCWLSVDPRAEAGRAVAGTAEPERRRVGRIQFERAVLTPLLFRLFVAFYYTFLWFPWCLLCAVAACVVSRLIAENRIVYVELWKTKTENWVSLK